MGGEKGWTLLFSLPFPGEGLYEDDQSQDFPIVSCIHHDQPPHTCRPLHQESMGRGGRKFRLTGLEEPHHEKFLGRCIPCST